jgi:uncharacterized protein (TIGR03437 family)
MSRIHFVRTAVALLAGIAFPYAAPGNLTPRTQTLTPAPHGPYRVAGNHVTDSLGRTVLLRGTGLPEFRREAAVRDSHSGIDFGPYSATSLSAVRLRFNMNAVRLPLNIEESDSPGYFAAVAKVVHTANRVDLIAILAAREPGADLPTRRSADFWRRCAAYFRDYPNVMFDLATPPSPTGVADAYASAGWDEWRARFSDLAHVVRAAGAQQPVLAAAWNDARQFEGVADLLSDANVIYEAAPRYAETPGDGERGRRFGFLASRAPVFARWDLDLEDRAECAVIPHDPEAASALVEDSLNYFDAHAISWSVSTLVPGKLVKDLSLHDSTSLENGWTCGNAGYPGAGLGRVVQAHMRATHERELYVVSAAGGIELPRDGFAIAYGPVMAAADSQAHTIDLPLTLGKVRVEVTDAKGVARTARLFWASEGWGQINFVVPGESAAGPARMTIVREDGSRSSAPITITDTAPGFWTGVSCRGPAMGEMVQTTGDGKEKKSPLSACVPGQCRTLPVKLEAGVTTRLHLVGSGFRNASSPAKIVATLGGIRVPVISYRPSGYPGTDDVVIEIPANMPALGETDLLCRIDGHVSNAVRIRLAEGKPQS